MRSILAQKAFGDACTRGSSIRPGEVEAVKRFLIPQAQGSRKSSPLKIGLNASKGNEKVFHPSIFRCENAVSFREGIYSEIQG